MIATYFAALKSALATSTSVLRYQIREELVRVSDGVIRLKASLKDGGLLEIAEYVVAQEGRLTRVAYSYHWQDKNEKLIARWDNTPHFPHLPNAPHHIHNGETEEVAAGNLIHIFEVLDVIKSQLK